MDKILLTGAGGYLGSRVAAHLRRCNKAFDSLPCRLHEIEPGTLHYRYVIHCAGKNAQSGDVDYHAANALGTRFLLAGLGASARVVFVSSRKVYAQTDNVCVDENGQTCPSDDYGKSKLNAERYLKDSSSACVVFRAGGMFGHPHRCGRFADQALRAALSGHTIALATPSRQEDYLDVDLMAELLTAACADGLHWGHQYNVTGPVRSLDSMLGALDRVCQELLFRPISVRPTPLAVPRFPWLDNRKLEAHFPWFQQLDDAQIFRRMLTAQRIIDELRCAQPVHAHA